MGFKRIEEIEVWKRGCNLAVSLYRLTSQGEISREWSLRDQMRRAAISIPSNVAEGFERNSDVEFKRFLLIAKGSCSELRTQMIIASDLKLFPEEDSKKMIAECLEVSSMLQGLVTFLQHDQGKPSH